MSVPVVFISYSHKDKEWMERLVVKFAVPKRLGWCNVWTDQQIPLGEDWDAKIDEVLRNARVAVILVSDNFLASDFILEKEVPRLLERRAKGDLHIIPVIADSCLWKTLSWLQKMEVRPKEGNLEEKEIAEWRTELTNVAQEILSRFGSAPNSHVSPETPDLANRGAEEEKRQLKEALRQKVEGAEPRAMETKSGGTTQPSSGLASGYQERQISAGELPKRTQDDPAFRSAQLSEGKGDA
jgi:TIR domain-containing protein